MQTITAKEYAAKIGYSAASISKKLAAQHSIKNHLPGAKKVVKHGNSWMITLSSDFNAEKAKAKFKTL